MEEFFQYNSRSEELFWIEEEAFPVNNSSAFVKYNEWRSLDGIHSKICCAQKPNMNKRMVGFLKRKWSLETKQSERERCHRHMMSERARREKQKQSYSSLRSLLPPRTKSDKNSIVQVATKQIQELEKYKQELEWKNKELEAIVAEASKQTQITRGGGGGAKIMLRVASPSSGIDSILEVLKCMNKFSSKTRAIHASLSAHDLSAVLEIDSEVEVERMEKAARRTLFEVEKKFLSHIQYSSITQSQRLSQEN